METKWKNGKIQTENWDMDYIRFGSGRRVLLMLPGLGDGLQTVRGTALPMAWMYRIFSRDFTVYMFSRPNDLLAGTSTRDMARDVARAMEALGIQGADVLGVSMGGMIAQYLAIDHPEKVNKLILTVTASEPNPVLEESIVEWIRLAEAGDHSAFMESNLRRLYSEEYYRKNHWTLPLLGLLTKPASYERFFIQARACLEHDATAELGKIRAATLIVGGEKDLTLGAEASRKMAERIPGAELLMYPNWGHGLYEEEKSFNQRMLEFLLK